MIKETRELRHLKNIRSALVEIKLNNLEHKDDATQSLKAYQTIKCECVFDSSNEMIRFPSNVSFINFLLRDESNLTSFRRHDRIEAQIEADSRKQGAINVAEDWEEDFN